MKLSRFLSYCFGTYFFKKQKLQNKLSVPSGSLGRSTLYKKTCREINKLQVNISCLTEQGAADPCSENFYKIAASGIYYQFSSVTLGCAPYWSSRILSYLSALAKRVFSVSRPVSYVKYWS